MQSSTAHIIIITRSLINTSLKDLTKLAIISFIRVEYVAEVLYWIALDHTVGLPNKVTKNIFNIVHCKFSKMSKYPWSSVNITADRLQTKCLCH